MIHSTFTDHDSMIIMVNALKRATHLMLASGGWIIVMINDSGGATGGSAGGCRLADRARRRGQPVPHWQPEPDHSASHWHGVRSGPAGAGRRARPGWRAGSVTARAPTVMPVAR